MGRLIALFLALFLIAAVAGVLFTFGLVHEMNAAGPLKAEKLVYIEPGSSVRGIAAKLIAEGVIVSDLPFIVDARWPGSNKELKSGEYQIPARASISDVVAILRAGKTFQHRITIPEGLMSVEIVELLKNEPALTGEITDVPPEGSLLPETYAFSYRDTRQAIIDRMKRAMQEELKTQWEKRALDLPFSTPEEAATLASVVEKETGLKNERPRVAGVFINRLNKGIPLQSDPTVIYAVTNGKEKLNRGITYADLKAPSPYNTYPTRGLPPTPIANPGKASLAAVLNPEKNDYIYFVADGTGGHTFAKTLKDHNNNVAKWRKIEKNLK